MIKLPKDKEEVLCISVHVTNSTEEVNGEVTTVRVNFNGSCSTDWFKGAILPGAVDVQRYGKNGLLSLCATYELNGEDYTGAFCSVKIVNSGVIGKLTPVIQTDSKALHFLNGAHLSATIEGSGTELIIPILMNEKSTSDANATR